MVFALPSLKASWQAIVRARNKKNLTPKTSNFLNEVLELFPNDIDGNLCIHLFA